MLNDFFDKPKAIHESGVPIENPDNDKIINEAIIFDALKGDSDKLNSFYENIGAYGARDGILNESASIDNRLNMINQNGYAKSAAVLSIANESADNDYTIYKKAILLAEATLSSLNKKYGNLADERLNNNKSKLLNNARVKDAMNKIK